MNKKASIFTLGEDVLYLVLKQIHHDSPSSLYSFSMASRECEEFAGPILYRSVTLSDKGDESTLLRMKSLFKRFSHREDLIHSYIREIVIADWGEETVHPWPRGRMIHSPDSESPLSSILVRNGESKLISCLQLENLLDNIKRLEAFSWDSKSHIPESVISKLEKSWPAAKLHVTNNRRKDDTADTTMDIRLLSSPLLYSLNYTIYVGSLGNGMVYSEFRQLKDILLNSSNLEVLSLAVFDPAKLRGTPPVPRGPLTWHPHRPVTPEQSLTKLYAITIPERWTDTPKIIANVYGVMFTQLNDLSHLKQLDLRNPCISYSLEPLMGRVPNLKRLDFFYAIQHPNIRAYTQQRCRDAAIVRDFLQSINALERLHIQGDDENLDVIWPGIVKHCDSLRHLFIHTRPDQRYRREAPPVLRCDQIERLQQSKIEHLALDVSIPDIAWFSKADHGHNDHDLDPSIALALANFVKVERLKLYVELPTDASVFSIQYDYDAIHEEVPVPALDERTAREVATGLYQQIFLADPNAALQELEICFCRLEIGDRMDSAVVHHPVTVRKRQLDYTRKPKARGYTVKLQGDWTKGDASLG